MKISRRDFCQTIAGAAALGILRPRLTFAQAGPAQQVKQIIYISLRGGMDSRLAYPYFSGGPIETALRDANIRGSIYPTSSLINQVAGLNQNGRVDQLGFHPKFKSLTDEFANGAALAGPNGIALLTEIGVTKAQSLSHEEMQARFDTGVSESNIIERGHIGRLIDAARLPAFAVWGIAESSQLLMNAETNPALMVGNLSDFQFGSRWNTTHVCSSCPPASRNLQTQFDDQLVRDVEKKLLAIQNGEFESPLRSEIETRLNGLPGAVDFARQAAAIPLDANFFPTVGEGNSFRVTLRDVARLVSFTNSSAAAPQVRSSLKILATSFGGWDMHTNVAGGMDFRVGILSDALRGLARQLKLWNLWDDTVIVVTSEFCRTIRTNSGGGTDHASAQNCLVLGGKIKKQVVGGIPSLTETQTKNAYTPQVAFTSILRELYKAGGIDAATIDQVMYERFPSESNLGLFA